MNVSPGPDSTHTTGTYSAHADVPQYVHVHVYVLARYFTFATRTCISKYDAREKSRVVSGYIFKNNINRTAAG